MDPIRVALIGYGLAGRAFHSPLIASLPGLELAAVVTRDEERRDAVRRVHPGAELLESADEIWPRRDDFGLVVVAAPNRTHVPLATASIDAGLPVVVDKPLAATAADANDVVAHARRAGVMLTVFQNRRWDGDFLTLRRLVEAGELGRVMRFESRFERWRPEIKEGWREEGDPEEAGGVLFDLGSHLIDQALQLFGPIESIYAELDARRPGAQVDDDAFVALEHTSGVRSHLWMSAVAADLGPRMRVLGDRAAYVKHGLDVQEAALRAGVRPGGASWGVEERDHWGWFGMADERRHEPTEPGAYPAFYAGVERAIRGSAPPPVTVAEAVASLTVVEAALRSGRERGPVTL
jgi:predicted dehydrogenase